MKLNNLTIIYNENCFYKFIETVKSMVKTASISDYIDIDISKLKANKKHKNLIPIKILDNLIQGTFEIQGLDVKFISKNKKTIIDYRDFNLELKKLFLLHCYIKYLYIDTNLLIIDKPETFLPPIAQIKFTRLIAMMVNAGTRIFILTSSDFILRELNNLIMLSNDFSDKERLMKKYKYKSEQIIEKENINVYSMRDREFIPVKIDKYGIKIKFLDKFLTNINQISDSIASSVDL